MTERSKGVSSPAKSDSPARAASLSGAPLGHLLESMRSGAPAVAEAAWAECFRQYHERVWARVFYVLRTIPWLKEPREVAADVAGQVFLALPEAVRNYREVGRPEQWLMQVAVRTALRHRESVTGRWSSGRRKPDRGAKDPPRRGRSYVPIDELANEIAHVVDVAEADARFDLRRRIEAWRHDPARQRYVPFIELFLEGYSHDEIAERLGITPGTSRTWLWKIRQHLAEGLEDDMIRHDEEVAGREAGSAPVISILPWLDQHPKRKELKLHADGLLGTDAAARVTAHLGRCDECAGIVRSLRYAMAMLAVASAPPADLFQRVMQRRRSGERALIVTEGHWPGMAGPGAEAAGRDAEAPAEDGEQDGGGSEVDAEGS